MCMCTPTIKSIYCEKCKPILPDLRAEFSIPKEKKHDILRKCIVKGNDYYFHKWSDKATVLSSGEIRRLTVGIIESITDGTVHECYPHEIRFLTTPESDEITTIYYRVEDIKNTRNLEK